MPKSITRLPPEPKVGSSVPLAERRRTTQKELAGPPPPAATTRPLGCTSTALAASMPPKLTVFFPPLPKVVSRSPACAMPRPYPALLVRRLFELHLDLVDEVQRELDGPAA